MSVTAERYDAAEENEASVRPWRWFATVGTELVGVYFVLPVSVQNFTYDGFGLACVGAIAFGVRRYQPRRTWAWTLLGGGVLLFVAGDMVLSNYQLSSGTQPFPSIADGLYLIGYALLVGGLVILVRSRARGADRAAMIDGLILALGAGTALWAFWIVQYTHAPATSGTDTTISIAYPMMDVVLGLLFASDVT